MLPPRFEVAAVLAACVLLAACSEPEPGGAAPAGVATELACADGLDDDGDGRTDCADVDCTTDEACVPFEECSNGADDDFDGKVDCDDPDCGLSCRAVETVCDDWRDDDFDGLADCGDPDCAGSAACGGAELSCADGLDDDFDGEADCEDADCAADPACGVPVVELCDNGVDDDEDGLTDCGDPACVGGPACPGELCGNGQDDDLDGAQDCDDHDCGPADGCMPEDCGNRADDDGDGLFDCADPYCDGDPACGAGAEDCGNGRDDDGDGAVDCGDAGCAADPRCRAPEDCGNLLDDDGDGLSDCLDPDCAGVAGCSGIGDPCTGPGDCAGSCLDEASSGWPGGYCSQSCLFGGADNGGCPASADCHEASAGALCFQRCAGDADCRSGYSCDAQYSVCVFLPVGGAPIGGGCTVPADCVTGACLPEALSGWPGGYCSADCSRAVCPAGSSCIATTGGDLCLDDCARNGDCRGGYVCDAVAAVCVYPG